MADVLAVITQCFSLHTCAISFNVILQANLFADVSFNKFVK